MILPSVTHLSRPRPVAFVVSLLLAWLLLALLAIGLRRGPIEDDLAARATAAVRGVSAGHAQATVAGREVTLHGTFPSQAAATDALRAAQVDGVSSARLATDVVIASEPARPVVVAVTAGSLAISATVPDRDSRAELLGAAVAATSGRLTGEVAIDPKAAAPALPPVADLVSAMSRGPGSRSLTVDGASVVLTGTTVDRATRSTIGAAVLAAARTVRSDAVVDNRIAVEPAAAAAAGDAAAARIAADPGAQRALAELRAALAGQSISFAVDSQILSADDRAVLDRIAAALRPGALPVVVAGHTDAAGGLALNQALSLGRAQTAVAYLVGRGVPVAALRAAGFGAATPIADNATTSGRAANRRVEITPDATR
jgi:OOP family OmpA-OmpF porin